MKKFLVFLLLFCLPIWALEQVDCSKATNWSAGGGSADHFGTYVLGSIVRLGGKVWKCKTQDYWNCQPYGQPGGANSATY